MVRGSTAFLLLPPLVVVVVIYFFLSSSLASNNLLLGVRYLRVTLRLFVLLSFFLSSLSQM